MYHLLFECHIVLYTEPMRNSFFTGFLTLGSFLMSVASFLVVQLNTNIYSKDRYAELHQKLDPKNSKRDGLREFTFWIILNIVAALTTSFLQVTVGFVKVGLTDTICMLAALVTFLITGRTIYLIRRVIVDMFDWLDDEDEAKLQKAKQQNTPPPAKPNP